MKITTSPVFTRGLSVVEMLIVMAVLTLLVGMMMPGLPGGGKDRARRIQCINNLKQVSLGFLLYSNDGDPYPSFDPTNSAWNYFQIAGGKIGSAKVLLCPDDKQRQKAALDFETNGSIYNLSSPNQQNNALSYLYGVDSTLTQPDMILAGDRNISTNDSLLSGLLTAETNISLRWTPDLHKQVGNVALADGSAHQLTIPKLQEFVRSGYSTNGLQRFVIP